MIFCFYVYIRRSKKWKYLSYSIHLLSMINFNLGFSVLFNNYYPNNVTTYIGQRDIWFVKLQKYAIVNTHITLLCLCQDTLVAHKDIKRRFMLQSLQFQNLQSSFQSSVNMKRPPHAIICDYFWRGGLYG